MLQGVRLTAPFWGQSLAFEPEQPFAVDRPKAPRGTDQQDPVFLIIRAIR